MDGLKDVIAQLESQRAAVEKALEALRAVSGEGAAARSDNAEPATRKGGMSPEGRRRLALAMKRRWAAKRTAGQAAKTTTTKKAPAKTAAKKKGGMTAAGRQKLAEAMRRRWAAKRTAAQAKKSPRASAA